MGGYDKRVGDMSPTELRTAREKDRKRRIRGQLDRARRRVAHRDLAEAIVAAVAKVAA